MLTYDKDGDGALDEAETAAMDEAKQRVAAERAEQQKMGSSTTAEP